MHPTQVCIVARLMKPATRRTMFVVVVACATLLVSCKDLAGREQNRRGGRLFRDSKFIDSAAEYAKALTKVEDPKIHYNLGLAYSKVFRPGGEKETILIGQKGESVCTDLPGTKPAVAEVCVKEGDRHYNECRIDLEPLRKALKNAEDKLYKPQVPAAAIKAAHEGYELLFDRFNITDLSEVDRETKLAGMSVNARIEPLRAGVSGLIAVMGWWAPLGVDTDPIIDSINSDEEEHRNLTSAMDEARSELNRLTCSSSSVCTKADMCALSSPQVADLGVKHWQEWLKKDPKDDETRKLMTKLWLDSLQYQKALDHWLELNKADPKDTKILNVLAGIYLAAREPDGDDMMFDNPAVPGWRKSIDWYQKVADGSADEPNKVAALQFIADVIWNKLNQKVLGPEDIIEYSGRGISALQKAIALQPKNPSLWGRQASIFNFRSLAHGSMWASAMDRATSLDLQKHTRVLIDQAKKAQAKQSGQPPAPADGTKAGG
jgi:tetratricopeptide (TPR) repeat protein